MAGVHVGGTDRGDDDFADFDHNGIALGPQPSAASEGNGASRGFADDAGGY